VRVHHLLAHHHARALARHQRLDAAVVQHLAQRVEVDAAAGQQPVVHHAFVVGVDLGARGQFVQALVQAHGVLAPVAQLQRVHAVEGRGLVQRDEGVGVVPVAAWLGVAVHQRDARVALVEHGVGEGHAAGACADDEVVGLKGIQGVHQPAS
jgi:hypothetical protein